MSPSLYLKMETDPVPEMLFSRYLEFQTMDKFHTHSDAEYIKSVSYEDGTDNS
jgi:hypothetical protein